MKTTYIIFSLLVITLSLQAQIKNFQPGYYYQQSGDAIRAAMSQEGSDYLSVQVREDDGGERALSTADIQGFGFPEQGIHYRQIAHMFTSAEGEEMTVPRFGLVLADGENTLFRVELQANEISQAHWDHFQKIMALKIRRDWAKRFRAMMKAKTLDYDAVAKLAGFKNGKVVKATVTRGLPHFARLLVVLWEEEQTRARRETRLIAEDRF